MWESLKNVAEREECSVNALGSRIYRQKKSDESFTSAIRIFLMLYYRDAAREAGHAEAMQRPGTPESCRASVEEGEGRVAGVLPALRLCNLRRKSTARGAALKPTTRMNGPEVVNREGST
jgi:hypothetical protein